MKQHTRKVQKKSKGWVKMQIRTATCTELCYTSEQRLLHSVPQSSSVLQAAFFFGGGSLQPTTERERESSFTGNKSRTFWKPSAEERVKSVRGKFQLYIAGYQRKQRKKNSNNKKRVDSVSNVKVVCLLNKRGNYFGICAASLWSEI